MIDRVGGYDEMVPRFLELFVKNTAVYLEALRQAVEAGSDEQLRMQAHTIKGAAANIAAHRILETASALEIMGRDGEKDGVQALVDQLEAEFAEFKSYCTDAEEK